MVDDEVRRSAQELREVAAKLKLLVRQTRSATAQRELLDLAERLEGEAGRINPDSPDAG